MWGGELFVPKIPSYKILDIAKAIAPDCEHKIVGIRPGEKLHEEMITESDAMNTIEFDDYFVIVPSIETWNKKRFQNESNESLGKQCPDGFSYNSKSNKHFLSVEELRELIKTL
jgi:FlaA1/EpsC-like NDP-sugar epimerase